MQLYFKYKNMFLIKIVQIIQVICLQGHGKELNYIASGEWKQLELHAKLRYTRILCPTKFQFSRTKFVALTFTVCAQFVENIQDYPQKRRIHCFQLAGIIYVLFLITQKKMHHRTNKNLVKTTKVLLFQQIFLLF